MSTLPSDIEHRHVPEEEVTDMEVVAGGSIFGAIAGGGALALAIIGLAGVYPYYMLTIATICAGGALVFVGGSIATRYSKLVQDLGSGRLSSTELWSGMTAEFLGGTAGIVLGILGLLNISPITLTAVAAIVFGGVLLLGSGVSSRLNHLAIQRSGADQMAQEVARDAVKAGKDVQILIGLAGITLGILALSGLNPMVLILVAMLTIGFSILLSGSTVAGRMLTNLR